MQRFLASRVINSYNPEVVGSSPNIPPTIRNFRIIQIEIKHKNSSLEKDMEARYYKQVNQLIITPIRKPEQWLMDAAESIGLVLAGLTHEITNYFVNHSVKKHGKVRFCTLRKF
jgi:hypothetical protein